MDWSELNPELLPLIAKKLGNISNFVRFRVVCKKWRSAVRLSDQPPQLPWFLHDIPRSVLESSNIKAYSLYSKRTHTLYIPEAEGNKPFGSSSQYLLLCDINSTRSSSLVNPLTRSQIQIPGECLPVQTIYIGPNRNHNRNPTQSSLDVVVYSQERLFDGTLRKQAVRMSRRDERLAWTTIKVPCSLPSCYCEGMLYMYAHNSKDIRAFDVTTGDVFSVISTPCRLSNRSFHLIESFGDVFAVVALFKNNNNIPLEECRFKVYRLQHKDKESSWAKMSRGIRNRMLFLDRFGGFSLKACDFDGIKGNCIYFFKSNCKFHGDARYALCRYDIKADKTEVVIGWRKHAGVWFVPSLF